ncbi:50S ribosomal protein L34 [Poriferisphaera corsica]|uniref:Large ribosomal subunit protein bL34 n=1 Tax=Poriferisphaera corsica TaxID=2528020 RepID=A0A517YUI1_9BACT|nr:50S ribosomal protein L34 [Poriferisphaera corsica]
MDYSPGITEFKMATHYPKRRSLIKRARKFGFRARMRTKLGRKMVNRKRSAGRSVNVRSSF